MKKEYKKPYLLVETFQLDAAVASSCSSQGYVPINHYMSNCTAIEEEPDAGYFGIACAAAGGDDVTQWEGGDGNDGLCYHGPVADLSKMFMYS